MNVIGVISSANLLLARQYGFGDFMKEAIVSIALVGRIEVAVEDCYCYFFVIV